MCINLRNDHIVKTPNASVVGVHARRFDVLYGLVFYRQDLVCLCNMMNPAQVMNWNFFSTKIQFCHPLTEM